MGTRPYLSPISPCIYVIHSPAKDPTQCRPLAQDTPTAGHSKSSEQCRSFVPHSCLNRTTDTPHRINSDISQGLSDSHTDTFNKHPFTHRSFYTQAFTRKRFYTRKLLHTEAFTHRLFYTQTLYTQTLLHTDTFTHRPFYTQPLLCRNSFTHRRFYTQTVLHTSAFTELLLHTDAFTHRPAHVHAVTVKSSLSWPPQQFDGGVKFVPCIWWTCIQYRTGYRSIAQTAVVAIQVAKLKIK